MYEINYKIKKEDINLGNHVGNERALLFFQMARESFFQANGMSEIDLGNGFGIIQKNSFVNYVNQIYLDEVIKIIIEKIEIEKIKMIFNFKIYKEEKLLIEGYTTNLVYDYENRKVKKIPDNLLEIVKKIDA